MKQIGLKFICSLLFLQTSLYGYVECDPEIAQRNSSSSQLTTSSQLSYNGGPVITSVKIVNVLWGSNVNPQVTASMPVYLKAIVASSWIDGLSQYNTASKSSPTSHQLIGRGTFLGQFLITPSNTSNAITEADIQAELTAQLNAGHLPVPEYDELGNLESIYIIEFPPNLTITGNDGSVSCVDFCAFHSDMSYNGKLIMYAIHPDFSGGCASGCGSGTMLQNQQSVHSHELAEAITDPEVGTGTISWYNNTSGEIGDLCNQSSTDIIIDGQTYTVQQLWSNVRNKCVPILPSIPGAVNFNGKVVTSNNSISHELTWGPSTTQYLNGYRIVQGGKVVAVLSAAGPYLISLADRDPAQQYIYRLVAFNDSGIESTFEVVTLP